MYIQYTGNINSKESAYSVGDSGLICVGTIPWRTEWLSTPLCLPGESHGQRSLVGDSSWGCKEQDRTKQLTLHFNFISLYIHIYIFHIYTYTQICIYILGAISKQILNKHCYDD